MPKITCSYWKQCYNLWINLTLLIWPKNVTFKINITFIYSYIVGDKQEKESLKKHNYKKYIQNYLQLTSASSHDKETGFTLPSSTTKK